MMSTEAKVEVDRNFGESLPGIGISVGAGLGLVAGSVAQLWYRRS